MKIGIIGCGAIGSVLVEFLVKDLEDKIDLIGVCDIDSKKIDDLSERINFKLCALPEDELIEKSDLIVEAAGIETAETIIPKVIKSCKNLMVMSSGVFLKKPIPIGCLAFYGRIRS